MEPRRYPGGVYEGQELNSPVAIMRFTLVYDGRLPAQTTHDGRIELKHHMREVFHKQLAELWSERRFLREPLEVWRRFPARRDIWVRPESPDLSHIIEAAHRDIAKAARSPHTTRFGFEPDCLRNLTW